MASTLSVFSSITTNRHVRNFTYVSILKGWKNFYKVLLKTYNCNVLRTFEHVILTMEVVMGIHMGNEIHNHDQEG